MDFCTTQNQNSHMGWLDLLIGATSQADTHLYTSTHHKSMTVSGPALNYTGKLQRRHLWDTEGLRKKLSLAAE